MQGTAGRNFVGAALIAALAGPAAAPAATCWDKASIADDDPALIKAIQQRLRERSLYAGPIDGEVGRGTRHALGPLTGQSPRSDFRPWTVLVQQIFGPDCTGIHGNEDHDGLIAKLGVMSDPNCRNPCEVRVVEH